MAFALLIYWPSFLEQRKVAGIRWQIAKMTQKRFLSFWMSIADTIHNKVNGQPNGQPASKRFRLPAESSPTPSPTPAAAFLSDIAQAGAGALWPETPMHGWSRGKLRLFLDSLDRSSGESWQQGATQLPNLLYWAKKQIVQWPAPKTLISEQN